MTSGGPVPAVVFLGEIEKWVSDHRIVGNEPTVEVGKAKEGSYILDFSWGWPGGDAIEFDWVHSKLTGFHDHSKVFYLRDIKLAFLKLQVEVEFSRVLEDVMGLFFMGLWVGGGDKEVVHIDDEPSFSDHVSKRVVHESLKCGGRVAEAEKHDVGLKSPLCVMKAAFH